MARVPTIQELHGARLLKGYASWVYCTACEKTVAYLCYVTYDDFDFRFDCACGSSGHVRISFGEVGKATPAAFGLAMIKNRLCCPRDGSALLSLVHKNLADCHYEITCKACATKYTGAAHEGNATI